MSIPQYFSTTIGYSDVYDNYEQFDIDEVLMSAPSVVWLRIISQANAWMHSYAEQGALQSDFFAAWISLLPQDLAGKVKAWLSRVSKNGSKVNLINSKTSLLFIEKVYENFNNSESDDEIPASHYLKFFQCYIYLSQYWMEEIRKITSSKTKGFERYLQLFFPLQFSMDEIIGQKDFRLQVLKGIYFFKYCDTDENYKEALQNFLAIKGVSNWRKYILHVLGPYVKILAEKDGTPSSSLTLTNSSDLNKLFDSLCADPKKYKKLDDYKYLRNHPLFRYKEAYLFIFPNFFVDKLYQPLKFEFGDALVASRFLFKGKKLNSLVDFFRYYGEDFGEKWLFYQVLEFCFEKKRNYILKRGDDLKELLKDGEPDYYIRDGSKIYLFEFKDILIGHGVKNSMSYGAITDELDKKLIQNERGEPKGLRQLTNSISRISNSDYQLRGIDSFDKGKIIIYPILIFTDPTLYVRGVNYYLNQRFLGLLHEAKIDQLNIKPVTLINIDTFIQFQDLFHEKKISLNQCLNKFHSVIQSPHMENKVSTFEMSVNFITSKFTYDKTPKMFWEFIKDVMAKKDV